MKKFLCFILCTVSFSCFSSNNMTSLDVCKKASDTSEPGFCSDFKLYAKCQCEGLYSEQPEKKEKCVDMNFVYQSMIEMFRSQSAACHWQEHYGSDETSSYLECMEDWDCYRTGHTNSKRLCNPTGAACI